MGLATFVIFSKSSRGPLADSFCQGALLRSSSKAQASVFCLSLSWKLSWSALTSAGTVSCASYPVSFSKSGVGGHPFRWCWQVRYTAEVLFIRAFTRGRVYWWLWLVFINCRVSLLMVRGWGQWSPFLFFFVIWVNEHRGHHMSWKGLPPLFSFLVGLASSFLTLLSFCCLEEGDMQGPDISQKLLGCGLYLVWGTKYFFYSSLVFQQSYWGWFLYGSSAGWIYWVCPWSPCWGCDVCSKASSRWRKSRGLGWLQSGL